MSGPCALRYFAAVASPAAPLAVVLAILVLAAGALEAVDRGSSDWVLASIAVVQLFAASNGFTRAATRGHYDPVLIGKNRAGVALAHFAVSAGPGTLAWFACGAAQAIAARSTDVPAFRPAGWVTLLLVSAIPWATTVRAASFLGGALWLLISISLLLSGKVLGSLARLHARPRWADEHPLAAFGLGLAFPPVIPSLTWPAATLAELSAAATLALAAGVFLIVRAEFPLAEEGA